MLTITTLFFGLVAGQQTVELAAPAETARLAVAVDGTPCAAPERPPWRARCDFGPAPVPRRLTAIAYDGDGRELARTERAVNLFRAAAEVAIHLERSADGALRARLVGGSLTGQPPRSVRVELDGVAIPAPDPNAVALPPVAADSPHFLRAEFDWSDDVTAVGEAVFGGRFGDTVASELTAVPIESDRPAAADEVERALATPAGAAHVLALDKGPAELFVIPHARAIAPLARLGASTGRFGGERSSFGLPGGGRPSPTAATPRRAAYSLERDDRVRLLWPWPERRTIDGRDHALFPPSPPFTAKDGGLLWIVSQAPLPASYRETPRLAEAAAVAGMIAAGRERRRAVLVLLDDGDGDASRLEPAALRAYLAAVRVPLFVWRTAKRTAQTPDPWGEVPTVTSAARLDKAFRDLQRTLARQQIAWIEGAYLPTEVRLAMPGTLRLAGAGAP